MASTASSHLAALSDEALVLHIRLGRASTERNDQALRDHDALIGSSLDSVRERLVLIAKADHAHLDALLGEQARRTHRAWLNG